MLLSIWGTPMRTFSKMGMSSEKLGTSQHVRNSEEPPQS